ncbi:hypothetical protein NAH03_24735, partial [Stenotrophomonas maltophilia]|uniref:hypothetical protein n=1 Tax=Stenotrophomonas maltophilia TaxID=40324 RepID=UPI00224DCFF3|nr:hypothetical protein [Stenotrophomonas maltophilia]
EARQEGSYKPRRSEIKLKIAAPGAGNVVEALALGQVFTSSTARRCPPRREGVNLRLTQERLEIKNHAIHVKNNRLHTHSFTSLRLA